MGVVVVGGQARNIGKTSVVAGLIAAMPEKRWTAIKITPHRHGLRGMVIEEETERGGGTDTSRYLEAGAARAFLVRATRLDEAMPQIQALLDAAENAIVESNSVLRFLKADVAVGVMDPSVGDFKASAALYLDRVDAFVVPEGTDAMEKPTFYSKAPVYCSEALVGFVAGRL